jgi:hypothetical protein
MEEIMAAKAPSVKRYVVRLSAEERQQLEAMIRKGKSPAQGVVRRNTPVPLAVVAPCDEQPVPIF